MFQPLFFMVKGTNLALNSFFDLFSFLVLMEMA
jgi:hypothetical protein